MAIDYTNILLSIRSGKTNRDQAIIWLYKDSVLDNEITQLFKSRNWKKEEKDDLKAQAIMNFVAMVVRNKEWTNNSPIARYICSIVRNIKISQIKSDNKFEALPEKMQELGDEENFEKIFAETEQFHQLHTLLSKTGDKCREILLLWANDYSMQEIAMQMGYVGEGMARKKKYNCLKKLVTMIQDNPHFLKEYK